MKKIIAITGLTNSGKSTVADYLQEVYGIPNTSPIKPLKAFLENVYGLKVGELDDQAVKAEIPEEANCSFQDMLVDCFHFWRVRDSNFAAKMLASEIERLFLNEGARSISIQSIRNFEEVKTIAAMVALHDAELSFINVTGNREREETSDINLAEIEDTLMQISDRGCVISNQYDSNLFRDLDICMAEMGFPTISRLRNLYENALNLNTPCN
jgi:hypothetical protein